MTLPEEVCLLLKTTHEKHFAYISKNSENLRKLSRSIGESVDMDTATSRIVGVHPIGISLIIPTIDGVFADKGDTGEDHLRQHIKLSNDAKIIWVDPDTLELET